jgi:hypothetical protein
MKLNQIVESSKDDKVDQIHRWCDRYNLSNYVLEDDGRLIIGDSVFVHGNAFYKERNPPEIFQVDANLTIQGGTHNKMVAFPKRVMSRCRFFNVYFGGEITSGPLPEEAEILEFDHCKNLTSLHHIHKKVKALNTFKILNPELAVLKTNVLGLVLIKGLANVRLDATLSPQSYILKYLPTSNPKETLFELQNEMLEAANQAEEKHNLRDAKRWRDLAKI